MSEARPDPLAELRQLRERGLLSEAAYQAAVAGLPPDDTQTHATALGERAVQAEQAETVITGDNNSVYQIIHQYETLHQHPIDPDQLRQQIGNYLAWLDQWAGTLELRGIERQGKQVVQLDLEAVYVPLAATTYRQNTNMNNILGLEQRLILTGGPGCGKTTVLLHIAGTLARAIATDNPALAEEKLGWPAGAPIPLPLFVPLSLYVAHRRALDRHQDRTLAAFVSHYLSDRQVSFDLPPDFFQLLLRQGKQVILLLDGLDEVPDEAERAQVRQAVEDLVTGRNAVRAVVTCRTAAYQGRTALGREFHQVMVEPLTTEHIEQLVQRAYARLYAHDPTQRQAKTADLLTGIAQLESERQKRLGANTPRLIDSPLLVRLLLIVHYRDRRLPDQRAELYMKATEAMLLPDYAPDETVADEIGQLVGGNKEAHRELVQHLAFQMHRRGEQQGREIAEDELRRLLGEEGEDASLVADFVKLTRLRGTLLEEQLGMYRFLHLAFQEFLTARYLAEIIRSEGGVKGIIAFLQDGPLPDSWWREVVLLVAGYFYVTSPNTAHSFLAQLADIGQGEAVTAEVALAAAEIAAVACLEWSFSQVGLRQKLAERLGTLLGERETMSQTRLARRVAAGRALAQLGDPRPGVCTLEPEMLAVPAGPFLMGEEKHPITLEAFAIARYPVTNAQFRFFVEDGGYTERWRGCWTAEGWHYREHYNWTAPRFSGDETYNRDNQPVVGISWYEALAYCHWLAEKTGRPYRLPTEAEWERAARHTDGRRYPWGEAWRAEACNTKETGLNEATAVGLFPTDTAVCGAQDMAGNVNEWCQTRWWDENEKAYPRLYRADDGREALHGGNEIVRVVRGGSRWDNEDGARGAFRFGFDPFDWFNNIGFRVVAPPFSTSAR